MNLVESLCNKQHYLLYYETEKGPRYVYSGSLAKDSVIIWTQNHKDAKRFRSKLAVVILLKKIKEKYNLELKLERA